MVRATTARAFLTATLLLSAGGAAAQETQTGPFSYSIEGGAAHQSSADLKDGGGDFEMDRWFVSAGINYSWNPRNSIGLSVGGGRSLYTFDPASEFGGGDPWDTVEEFRISATARFKISETATVFIVPTVRFNAEKGADSGDSDTYGLFAAVAWRINEQLTIGPGIGVFSKLDDSSKIFPVLAIDWDITDRWNLGTGSGFAASQGPGLTLSYKVSPHWTVAVAGRYEDQEFRLDNEGEAAGGIGRDQSFPLVFSAAVQASKMARLSLFTGVEMEGKLKLKNTFGEVMEESSYDPALIVGASFALRF